MTMFQKATISINGLKIKGEFAFHSRLNIGDAEALC